MSPTRRDILRTSAGAVAAALAGIPTAAQVAALAETASEPVTVSGLHMCSFSYNLSDGGALQVLIYDDRDRPDGRNLPHAHYAVTRYDANHELVADYRAPDDLADAISALVRKHGDLHLLTWEGFAESDQGA